MLIVYLEYNNFKRMIENKIKNPYLKTISSQTETVIDSDGCIVDSNIKSFKRVVNDKEDFYLIYSKFLHILIDRDFTGLSDVKVYSYLLLNYPNVGTLIAINSNVKESIQAKTGLSIITIDVSLRRLTMDVNGYSALLIKVGRGTYQINPQYAWKGSTTERTQALYISLERELNP
jgi:hypothetical protein